MKTIKNYFILLGAVLVALTFSSCDTDGEETMSWRPGTGLHIVGPAEVIIGEEDSYSYYVDGFTVKETYTWTLDGAPITPIRNGEFVELEFDSESDHVLTVSNGTLSGKLDISVTGD
jgi:hypothetical protein